MGILYFIDPENMTYVGELEKKHFSTLWKCSLYLYLREKYFFRKYIVFYVSEPIKDQISNISTNLQSTYW